MGRGLAQRGVALGQLEFVLGFVPGRGGRRVGNVRGLWRLPVGMWSPGRLQGRADSRAVAVASQAGSVAGGS